jgi:hypothetical protein
MLRSTVVSSSGVMGLGASCSLIPNHSRERPFGGLGLAAAKAGSVGAMTLEDDRMKLLGRLAK